MKVYVESKQANIKVSNTNPSFSYEFKNDPIIMDKEEADVLIMNNNFKILNKKVKVNKISYDLNGDGVVDSKDASIAGKVMAKVRHNKKKGDDD